MSSSNTAIRHKKLATYFLFLSLIPISILLMLKMSDYIVAPSGVQRSMEIRTPILNQRDLNNLFLPLGLLAGVGLGGAWKCGVFVDINRKRKKQLIMLAVCLGLFCMASSACWYIYLHQQLETGTKLDRQANAARVTTVPYYWTGERNVTITTTTGAETRSSYDFALSRYYEQSPLCLGLLIVGLALVVTGRKWLAKFGK